jgi:hypothetical protein
MKTDLAKTLSKLGQECVRESWNLSRSLFDRFAFVIAAVRASLVGLLHFVAIGAFAQRRLG